jgi:alpha-glucoside transport system permease protein
MTTIVTTESLPPAEPAATPATHPVRGGARGGVGAWLHGLLGSIPTAVLWILVVLWSVPTLGTLVSSVRSETWVKNTGWWTIVEFDTLTPVPALLGGLVLGSLLFTCARSIALGSWVWWVATIVGLAALVALAAVTTPIDALAGVVLGALATYVWRWTDIGRRRWLVVGAVLVLGLAWLFARTQPLVQDTQATLDNYRTVFDTSASDAPNMWHHFLNSIAITVPSTVIPIAFGALAAYAFAWMDFPGRHWLFVSVVALLAVPFQMCLVPLLQLYGGGAHITLFGETITVFPDLDLQGSTTAVWLTHIGFGLPMAVFLLHNYIASLPSDLFEAARVDGADHATIFWRLVLPLSVPALAAFAIFQFLWVWNDYLVARTFLGSGAGELNSPMTVRLATLSGSRGQDWHVLTSAAFVSIAVPLIVFFALQRYFVRGLLAGSVKG